MKSLLKLSKKKSSTKFFFAITVLFHTSSSLFGYLSLSTLTFTETNLAYPCLMIYHFISSLIPHLNSYHLSLDITSSVTFSQQLLKQQVATVPLKKLLHCTLTIRELKFLNMYLINKYNYSFDFWHSCS